MNAEVKSSKVTLSNSDLNTSFVIWERTLSTTGSKNIFNLDYYSDGTVVWKEAARYSPNNSAPRMSDAPLWQQAEDRISLIIKIAENPNEVQDTYTTLKNSYLINKQSESQVDSIIQGVTNLDSVYRLFEIFRMIHSNEQKQSRSYGAAGGGCPNLGAQIGILKNLDQKIISLGGQSMYSRIKPLS
jgi:hypothetical protein